MTYRIEYIKEQKRIITTFSGDITDNDLINSANDYATITKNISGALSIISDFSQGTKFSVTTEGVKKNARSAQNASEINDKIAVVLISPIDLGYGLGRMWEGYAFSTGLKTKVARTAEEAHQWLNSISVD